MPKHLSLIIILAVCSCPLFAQKGFPPKEKTKFKTFTTYPQHMEFEPSMLDMLDVPDGWEVSVAASGLGKPRMLYLGPNGKLYITRRDVGDVLLLEDMDGDGKFDEAKAVVANFKGVHGITIHSGKLYACNNNEVRRYPLKPDGTVGEAEILTSKLPSGGQHGNRTMEFGPDGMLYVSVGSTCNDCNEGDKYAASLLRLDTVTWTPKVFASGLRNTIGFDWHPKTGELWGFDNGGDAKGNKWPPEEANLIIENGDYGWPITYGKREIDYSREDPLGTTKEAYAAKTQPSQYEFPAHSAPIAFRFFKDSTTVPTGYYGDGLICWHGSWNRKKPQGYKVQRVTFENGKITGAEDFLSGFLVKKSRFGRPAGVVIAPNGTVYVSDDANGVIYAVKPVKARKP